MFVYTQNESIITKIIICNQVYFVAYIEIYSCSMEINLENYSVQRIVNSSHRIDNRQYIVRHVELKCFAVMNYYICVLLIKVDSRGEYSSRTKPICLYKNK